MTNGSSPWSATPWTRVTAGLQALLFVSVYVVGIPWHLFHAHHHDHEEFHHGNVVAEDGHGEQVVPHDHDHHHHAAPHHHSEDHPDPQHHSQDEHSWTGLPRAASSWTAHALCPTLPPSGVVPEPAERFLRRESGFAARACPDAPRRIARPRGPPLS